MELNLSQRVKKEIEERTNDEFLKLNEEQKNKLSKTYKLTWIGTFSLLALFFIVCATYLLVASLGNLDAITIFGVIFLYSMSFGLIIFVIAILLKSKEKCARLWLKRNIAISIKENKSYLTDNYLESNNFKIEKVIPLPNIGWAKQELLFDNSSKRLVVRIGKYYSKIFKYSDILSYEVYENGNSVVKGTAGKALLGGAFFGLGGMIVGSSMSKTVSNTCTSLKLIIRLNDFDSPQIVFTYVDSIDVDKTSATYSHSKKNIQYVCSMLEFVINNKTLEKAINIEENKSDDIKKQKGQIKELKDMLGEGLITQEEYEAKKKQILGL